MALVSHANSENTYRDKFKPLREALGSLFFSVCLLLLNSPDE